ncbi:DUF4143 domain-containing protein, partial [Bdellovibrionales bacterium]|nr:DUF4143 domain-containing protein [Bdellovibrionales bacterium]
RTPLLGQCKESIFKLFFFDIGLLCHILDVTYSEVVDQKFYEKGFIAENFVQNELRLIGYYPTFSWQEGKSEIEFIYKSKSGNFFPLEVKSGKRTKAKSLRVYEEKYQPQKSIKLIGNKGSESKKNIVWPLYYAQYIKSL